MLFSTKKIKADLIDMMMGWRLSGFNVYCGPRIQSGEDFKVEVVAAEMGNVGCSQEVAENCPVDATHVVKMR